MNKYAWISTMIYSRFPSRDAWIDWLSGIKRNKTPEDVSPAFASVRAKTPLHTLMLNQCVLLLRYRIVTGATLLSSASVTPGHRKHARVEV